MIETEAERQILCGLDHRAFVSTADGLDQID
jgi:hypothetical protein